MKVGILTFHFSNNYGALLQAYALREWLISCGHKADFINYQPDYVEAGGDFKYNLNPYHFKANLKTAYLKFTHFRVKHFGSKEVKESMDKFRREKLGVENPVFKDITALCDNPPDYDMLICGSDQIWNPSEQFGVDPVYFLDFPSKFKRKISYAASFGSSDVKLKYHEKIRDLIMKLDGISVREDKSANFVESLTGRKCECVPDPTFLLNDYNNLIKLSKQPTEDCIFSYVLRSGDGFMEIAHALKNKLRVRVLSAYNPHRRWRDIGEKLTGGVIDWMGCLYSSRVVLTNSFHATVFSILSNRPFISVALPGARAGLSGRLENLLAKTGLSDRLIRAGDRHAALRLVDSPIDWTRVNAAVAKLRTVGRNYLCEQFKTIQ